MLKTTWLVIATASLVLTGSAYGTSEPTHQYTVVPPNKDDDIRLYYADGRVIQGADALRRMQKDSGLVLWLAGNQFFAMDDVVRAFQAHSPGTNVGLITLPPGLLLSAIESGGWRYGEEDFPGLPDVYASVNLGHLKKLRQGGLMSHYATYMHNELALMVAKGNPKKIAGIDDIKRADVRTSMPNPVSEGIMQFYGRKVLERHGLWDYVSAGQACASCQSTPNNWFTSVHHRETPDRILAGQSDAGIVWITEVKQAQRIGKAVDAVALPPADSLRDEVGYAIGALEGSPHAAAAEHYLKFLSTDDAKAAYGKHGFVTAGLEELALKPIP